MTMKKEQADYWSGDFGDSYTDRNFSGIPERLSLFTKILFRTGPLESLIELGANRGLNLQAINILMPNTKISALEINKKSIDLLRQWSHKIEIFHSSIDNFHTENTYDLVLTSGFLIHMEFHKLSKIYDLLYKISNKYICLIEYYNISCVEIPYRDHVKLFKRDFAGDILDRFSDIQLIDYGFCYHRDPVFSRDDLTWFLLQKKHSCC